MFEEMWSEIQDMQGEIFDIDETTGWDLFPNQMSITEDEMNQMETLCHSANWHKTP